MKKVTVQENDTIRRRLPFEEMIPFEDSITIQRNEVFMKITTVIDNRTSAENMFYC